MNDDYKFDGDDNNESKNTGAASSNEIINTENITRVSDMVKNVVNVNLNEEDAIVHFLQKAIKYSSTELPFTFSHEHVFFLINLFKSTNNSKIHVMVLHVLFNVILRDNDLIIETLFLEFMDIFYSLFQNKLEKDELCDKLVLLLDILSLFKIQYTQIIFSDDFFVKLLEVHNLRGDVTKACFEFMAVFSGEQPLNIKNFKVFNDMLSSVNEGCIYSVSKVIQHMIEFSQAQKFGIKFREILVNFIEISKGNEDVVKNVMIGLSHINYKDSNLFQIPEVQNLVAEVLANTESIVCPICLEALYNLMTINQEICISTFFSTKNDLTPLLLYYLDVAKFNAKFAASMILFKLIESFPDPFVGMLVSCIKDNDETFLIIIEGFKSTFQCESPIMLVQMSKAFRSLCIAVHTNGLFSDFYRILDESQLVEELHNFEFSPGEIEDTFDEIRRIFFDEDGN